MNAVPVRLVLSGYYGFGNLGDEALLEVIIEQVRTRFPYAIINVLSNTPEETAHMFRVEATPRMDVAAVRKALRAADVVVSGGGGLLQNTTSLKSLMYYAGIIHWSIRARKKTMIFAQSVGPLDALGSRIVSRLCRRISLATVRDGPSEAILRRLLPAAQIEKTADPVFLYEAKDEPDAGIMRGLEAHKGPLALISVRRSAQAEKVAQRIALAVDYLASRENIQSVFLPLGGASDAELSAGIIRRCKSKPLLLPACTLATAAAVIARCRVVVGMRLHALILAATLNVPFLALAYDPKVSALLDELEYPLPPLWTAGVPIDSSSLVPLLDRLLDEHTLLKDSLVVNVARLQKAAARNFTLLEELVGGG